MKRIRNRCSRYRTMYRGIQPKLYKQVSSGGKKNGAQGCGLPGKSLQVFLGYLIERQWFMHQYFRLHLCPHGNHLLQTGDGSLPFNGLQQALLERDSRLEPE